MPYFHVSSTLNRSSIQAFGLDWSRMGLAVGIAGSPTPEVEGCFLAIPGEVDFFVRINNTGGPVDVWRIDGISSDQLVEAPEGFSYYPGKISPHCLSLTEKDLPPDPMRP